MSTKKINVGIVGSSFSTGTHHGNEDHPFEKMFADNCDENFQFYNLACGGKGVEKYLQSIVHLKKTYNISILIFEVVLNRASFNFQVSEWYTKQHQNDRLDSIKQSLYDRQGYGFFEKHLQHQGDPNWNTRPLDRNFSWPEHKQRFGFDCDLKTAQNWQRFMIEINANWIMRDMTTVIDLDATINLCDILGIKYVSWLHNQFNLPSLECWNDIQPKLNMVKFNQFNSAREYFENKYPKRKLLADNVHFTDTIDRELVKEWLLPAVESVAKQINT